MSTEIFAEKLGEQLDEISRSIVLAYCFYEETEVSIRDRVVTDNEREMTEALVRSDGFTAFYDLNDRIDDAYYNFDSKTKNEAEIAQHEEHLKDLRQERENAKQELLPTVLGSTPIFQVIRESLVDLIAVEDFYDPKDIRYTGEIYARQYLQHPERVARNRPFAETVSDTELCRLSDNDGHEIHTLYRTNQYEVRQLFVSAIVDGNMYRTIKTFIDTLKDAHTIASRDDVYSVVGNQKHDYRLPVGVLYCEIAPRFELKNGRLTQALQAAEIAKLVDDPYAVRFEDGPFSYAINLEGIDPAAQPYDTYKYEVLLDDNGYPDMFEDYTYHYAKPDQVIRYLDVVRRIGQNISGLLEAETIDRRAVIDLAARQYQVLANTRPFAQINNSLAMNLFNAQIKLAGQKGILHGNLDTIAHHLQPDSFAAYVLGVCDGTFTQEPYDYDRPGN